MLARLRCTLMQAVGNPMLLGAGQKRVSVLACSACSPMFGGDGQKFPDVRTARPVLDPMDFWKCRFEDVYYPIRGTLANEGSESLRVALQVVTFISGSSNLCTDTGR